MWKTLLVEDEKHSLSYLRNIISWEEEGFVIVGECKNGLSAFEFIKEHQPDLIVCDIMMPVMDGITLLKTVRNAGYESRFIMLTCINEFEYAQQAIEHGASGYILKLSLEREKMQSILKKLNKELQQMRKLTMIEKLLPEIKNNITDHNYTDHPEINKIMNYIYKNYKEQITLKEMSAYINMNQSYVSELFSKKTGHSLISFVQRVRIEKSISYLSETDLPISHISESCGFITVNYYIRIFKRMMGKTPSEFRKSTIIPFRSNN